VEGAEVAIDYDGFVYVDPGAGDCEVSWQIQRQIKSSLGALREQNIGVRDRDARSNLDPATWTPTHLDVIDSEGNPARSVDRVTYHYHDVAVVDRDRIPSGPLASFNYYDQDFIDMHPGGSSRLDVVSSGLAAYWQGMGEATAHYLLSLIDGHNNSWSQLLTNMRVDLPWHTGYDPMRVVNGDHDNQFSPDGGPVSLVNR